MAHVLSLKKTILILHEFVSHNHCCYVFKKQLLGQSETRLQSREIVNILLENRLA